jgi:hypothetical protein
MTAPCNKIAQSLAARGRPVNWANEAESAILSGMGPERFRKSLPQLETLGFPKPNTLNGLRSIPAILAFWRMAGPDAATQPIEHKDESELESWHDQPYKSRQRVAS